MSANSSAQSSKRSSFSEIDVPTKPHLFRGVTSEPAASASATTSAAANSSSSPAGGVLVDVLCRDFPKPTEELNVAEMIDRTPPRRSLRHYVKNARDVPVSEPSKEEQARKFAETKNKLLKAKDALDVLPSYRS